MQKVKSFEKVSCEVYLSTDCPYPWPVPCRCSVRSPKKFMDGDLSFNGASTREIRNEPAQRIKVVLVCQVFPHVKDCVRPRPRRAARVGRTPSTRWYIPDMSDSGSTCSKYALENAERSTGLGIHAVRQFLSLFSVMEVEVAVKRNGCGKFGNGTERLRHLR